MLDFVALRGVRAANGGALAAVGKGFRAMGRMRERPAECRQVEDLLPYEAVEALRAAALAGQGGLLLLEESLPAPWLDLNWESLTLAGRELGKSALIVRRARPKFGAFVRENEAPARWMNLFPAAEFDFNRRLGDLVEMGALRPTTHESFANDVARAHDLFVVAHASERGLEDRRGMPYALPPAAVLSRRFWLLACNKSGAMDALARKLLDQGAGCVVSANGDLSAPEMLEAVRRWLSNFGSEGLASWLLANRAPAGADGGTGALRLWGDVWLDRSSSAPWNASTWKMEHGDDDRIALGGDTTSEEYFAAVASYNAPETWELTRAWMAPRLLWLAERYDHPSMAIFESAVPHPQTADDYEALSGAARRIGHYPQAAKYLAKGLSLPRLSEEGKSVLLGNLTNVLIDLDLPYSAGVTAAAFEDCAVTDRQVRQDNDFRRLDFRARIAAREGKLAIAMDRMREKRVLASATGDDRRELAGSLYLAAWALLTGEAEAHAAKSLASQVLDHVSNLAPTQIGTGNDTTAYLVRALAAYFWASRDEDVLPQLRSWQQFAAECLSLDDPGPWGYIIAYLYLAEHLEQPLFERAMEALGRARYFLESAMFLSLAGHPDDSSRALSRFGRRRKQTLDELGSQHLNLGINGKVESAARAGTEAQARGDANKIAKAGLLPL